MGGSREGERKREIRVRGSITSQVKKDTTYETITALRILQVVKQPQIGLCCVRPLKRAVQLILDKAMLHLLSHYIYQQSEYIGTESV